MSWDNQWLTQFIFLQNKPGLTYLLFIKECFLQLFWNIYLEKRSPNFVDSPVHYHFISLLLEKAFHYSIRLFLWCLFVQANAYSEFQVNSEVHMNWTLFGNFGSRSGELLIKMYMVGQLICTSQDYQTALFCWLINLIQSCGQQPLNLGWNQIPYFISSDKNR